ncbi:hypothetical protein R3P38DRAFT_2769557 [Favolaschia claudopus]|uniref:Uncharacterized protein n=1 Tax=Favolaschia claudopus TaxID=2862362 RepID=A0AAW0CKA8_9AGAR
MAPFSSRILSLAVTLLLRHLRDCDGPRPNQCFTCPDGKLKNGGSCTYVCPTGTFNIPASGYYECDSSCATCLGPGFNNARHTLLTATMFRVTEVVALLVRRANIRGRKIPASRVTPGAACDGSAATCTRRSSGKTWGGNTCVMSSGH